MCNTWSIKYSCNHTIQVRRSKCLVNFTTQPKRGGEPKAKCSAGPLLTLCSTISCGPCSRKEREAQLQNKVEALRARDVSDWTTPASEELQQAETAFANQSYLLGRHFPARRYEKCPLPQHGKGRTRGSLLRQDVRPEEVILRYGAKVSTTGGGWDDDWTGGWKTMEEELAEIEAEKPDEIKEYDAQMAEDYARWFEATETEAETQAQIEVQDDEQSTQLTSTSWTVDEVETHEDELLEQSPSTSWPVCSPPTATATATNAENSSPSQSQPAELKRRPKTSSLRRKATDSGDAPLETPKCFKTWLVVTA